jgi:hypothetical protein
VSQGSREAVCSDSVVFSYADAPGGSFGVSSLLAVFFLVLSLSLLYAGEGENQLYAAVAGLILSFILGMLNWPWYVVSAAILFLGIVVAVGRYSRKNG